MSVRLTPERMDKPRDPVLDIEDATSISPSFTLPYTLVETKIRLKECCGMVDAFVKCSPGLLVPSHSVCDCSWAADSLPATEMLELDLRWYTVVYIPDVPSRTFNRPGKNTKKIAIFSKSSKNSENLQDNYN
jgi:hypothetical protein